MTWDLILNTHMAFRFQAFPIYKEIRTFIKEIYLLSRTYPKKEQFELAAQLRRGGSSILLNIAEGSAKKSDAEFNRFIMIAIGSITEIVAILDISLDQKYITPTIYKSFIERSESIARRLYGFSRRLTKKL